MLALVVHFVHIRGFPGEGFDPARRMSRRWTRDRLETILAQAKKDRRRLDGAAMGTFSLTTLGIASVVGAGIFVTTGTAAAQYSGPAVVISFVLAGIAAGLTAICYAELAAMIPIAGSTYSYAYAAFGMFLAWFIGWDLLLEYLFAASTVAVGWAGYFVSLLGSLGIHVPHDLVNPPFGDDGGDPQPAGDRDRRPGRPRCCSSACASRRARTTRWWR